jgi:lipoprotein-releasing system permease protein
LKTEYFISQRIIRSGGNKTGLSSGITGIAVAAIALGLAVMIVAVAVVTGFKNEIRDKIIGFGSHIQIVNYDSNVSYETKPIDAYPSYLPAISSHKEIVHLQAFSIKAGIVKTNENIEGLVLKGVNRHFDWSFFEQSLISGHVPLYSDTALSNDVLISSYLSKRLSLSTGDEFQMWFVMDSPRFRKFRIVGIYETSLLEFDKTFAFVDIQHIQRLNNWDDTQISGYELQIKDFDKLEMVSNDLNLITAGNFFEDGTRLKVINIVERYPQIFDWLNLQNLNVVIIIILMLVVAGFNMISGLIIMILERTNMIGILKALGAENFFIRKIFLYQSAYLIVRGLFWGNLLGIALCLIQLKFEVLSLDPSSYYLTTVPVNLSIVHLALINIGTISIILIFLLIPSKIVSSISPAKAIRFN